MLQVIGAGRGSITTFIELLSTGSRSVSVVPAVSGTTPFLIAEPSSDGQLPAPDAASRRLKQLPVASDSVVLPWEHWSTHFGDVLSSQFEAAGIQSQEVRRKGRPNHRRNVSLQDFAHAYIGRGLEQETRGLVDFDVDGDGAFSAADYVVLMHLGLRWTNSYSEDAEPWIQTFKNVTGRSNITDWMMQSTDPDFLCVAQLPVPTHILTG